MGAENCKIFYCPEKFFSSIILYHSCTQPHDDENKGKSGYISAEGRLKNFLIQRAAVYRMAELFDFLDEGCGEGIGEVKNREKFICQNGDFLLNYRKEVPITLMKQKEEIVYNDGKQL